MDDEQWMPPDPDYLYTIDERHARKRSLIDRLKSNTSFQTFVGCYMNNELHTNACRAAYLLLLAQFPEIEQRTMNDFAKTLAVQQYLEEAEKTLDTDRYFRHLVCLCLFEKLDIDAIQMDEETVLLLCLLERGGSDDFRTKANQFLETGWLADPEVAIAILLKNNRNMSISVVKYLVKKNVDKVVMEATISATHPPFARCDEMAYMRPDLLPMIIEPLLQKTDASTQAKEEDPPHTQHGPDQGF